MFLRARVASASVAAYAAARPQLRTLSCTARHRRMNFWCVKRRATCTIKYENLQRPRTSPLGRKIIHRRRPYRVEYTGSLSTSEVKQHRARLVLGWGTAWEDLWVLSAFHIPCATFATKSFIENRLACSAAFRGSASRPALAASLLFVRRAMTCPHLLLT